MARIGFAWECSCGHVEYGEESPEECSSCNRLESFVRLPEEIIAEREKEMSSDLMEEDLISFKQTKKTQKKNLKPEKRITKKTNATKKTGKRK